MCYGAFWMSANFMTGVVIALLCVGGVGAYWAQARGRRRAVARWAARRGLTLLRCSAAVLQEATPFVFTISKARPIYRVTVREANGQTRAGWLRLGGVGGDGAAEVRWDA